jgi:hypothetical protein
MTNRQRVRSLFRMHGIEFPYHRACANGRYSFKIEPIHELNKNAEKQRDAILRKMYDIALSLPFAESFDLDLQIVPTNRECSYPKGTQHGIAVRFKDQ